MVKKRTTIKCVAMVNYRMFATLSVLKTRYTFWYIQFIAPHDLLALHSL